MAHPVHRLLLATLGPGYRLLGRVTQSGREHVPQGGAVLVFNHPRNRDPVDVAAAYRRPLYFLGKKEAFEWPIIGRILRDVGGQIPLDREAGGNLDAMSEAVRHLEQGEKIAIAPEATRTHGRPLGRGRSGAVRLAWAADVPIVPVAITHDRLSTHVRFGEAVDLADVAATPDPKDPRAVRAATDHVMGILAGMLGQDYDPATAPDYAAAKGFGRGRPWKGRSH